MHFNHDGFGDLFDESEDGMAADNFEQVMDHMTRLMEDHGMPVTEALDGMLNLLKPGATDSSHDILQDFRIAMAVQGHLDAARTVRALWLIMFPWGLGFHFGFDRDFDTNGMPREHKHAVLRSLAAILNAGGIEASVTDNDLLRIKQPGNPEQNIDVVVTKFRQELDAELGPDAPFEGLPRDGPELKDWLQRWMPEE